MRLLIILTLLALAACVTDSIARRAGLRRVAGAKLKYCLDHSYNRQQCIDEQNKWCHDHGLYDNCGVDDAW